MVKINCSMVTVCELKLRLYAIQSYLLQAQPSKECTAGRSHLLLFASVYASPQATAKEKLRLVSVVVQGVEILGRVVPCLPVKVELELL